MGAGSEDHNKEAGSKGKEKKIGCGEMGEKVKREFDLKVFIS